MSAHAPYTLHTITGQSQVAFGRDVVVGWDIRDPCGDLAIRIRAGKDGCIEIWPEAAEEIVSGMDFISTFIHAGNKGIASAVAECMNERGPRGERMRRRLAR